MGLVFRSKSELKAKQEYRDAELKNIEYKSILTKSIFWIGKNDALRDFGQYLGFTIESGSVITSDISKIVCAECLIFNEADVNNIFFRLIGFSVNYDVPCFWIHTTIDPGRWMTNFRGIFVGSFEPEEIWRKICEILS